MSKPFSADSLQHGNRKQKLLWKDLNEHSILNKLVDYNPFLAGTIPLDIDHGKSDVDILCEYSERKEFVSSLESSFDNLEGFEIIERYFQELPSILCRFKTEKFEYEIFAQTLPVSQQMGYVHFTIEGKILSIAGSEFKERIQTLKRDGWKTEEAFCKLLGVREDPYEFLFGLNFFPPENLIKFVLKSEFFLKKDK
ncbi:hypothetical protein A0128_18370 [Leptospira tipperaryensis]|uniref:Diadenosine tetraphosphate hydrolase n=1 Tax=Leptospira tipperaryensis TaxID=2564040 RepID=A0A1D7V1B1_9LEPT|nr:DUF4269 domain-containing protein [Leptospira tipperaryensis]AOP35634.1 hypothetical protein A0128_18370 [Leptospira tipperaryensis]